jgi:hypothetical protein
MFRDKNWQPQSKLALSNDLAITPKVVQAINL